MFPLFSMQSMENREMILNTQSVLLIILILLVIVFSLCKYNKQSFTELIQNLKVPVFSSLNSNSNTVEKLSHKNKNIKILFLFAKWCGHCNAFKPEWAKFENWANENNIACEKVEADTEDNKHLLTKYNIEGFPTILCIDSNTGEKIMEYNSERTSNALERWVKTL